MEKPLPSLYAGSLWGYAGTATYTIAMLLQCLQCRHGPRLLLRCCTSSPSHPHTIPLVQVQWCFQMGLIHPSSVQTNTQVLLSQGLVIHTFCSTQDTGYHTQVLTILQFLPTVLLCAQERQILPQLTGKQSEQHNVLVTYTGEHSTTKDTVM